jgi:hypothetical protein
MGFEPFFTRKGAYQVCTLRNLVPIAGNHSFFRYQPDNGDLATQPHYPSLKFRTSAAIRIV